jgi:hypothetical protein
MGESGCHNQRARTRGKNCDAHCHGVLQSLFEKGGLAAGGGFAMRWVRRLVARPAEKGQSIDLRDPNEHQLSKVVVCLPTALGCHLLEAATSEGRRFLDSSRPSNTFDRA